MSERWEHRSLEWIHEARARNAARIKKQGPSIKPSEAARRAVKRLGLRWAKEAPRSSASRRS
jgi:hypothetical protein